MWSFLFSLELSWHQVFKTFVYFAYFSDFCSSNFNFLQDMLFKTVIAQISLPGRNQSAGTVYELDEIEVCNPQGGDSY